MTGVRHLLAWKRHSRNQGQGSRGIGMALDRLVLELEAACLPSQESPRVWIVGQDRREVAPQARRPTACGVFSSRSKSPQHPSSGRRASAERQAVLSPARQLAMYLLQPWVSSF